MERRIALKKYIILGIILIILVGAFISVKLLKSKAADVSQNKEFTINNTCKISVKEDSSWKEENSFGSVINVIVNNSGSKSIENWSIDIKFSKDITVDQIWCADKTVEKNNLKITPVQYNKTILTGQNINFGFLVKSDEKIDFNNLTVYFNNQICNGSNTEEPKKDEAVEDEQVNVDNSDNITVEGERYFKEKLSVQEMKSRSEAISKKEVKQLLYNEIDEHWDVLSKKLGQKDKKKVYALFLGFATRESTLNAGVETAQEQGFGVNPAHAFGPLQTAVTAFKGCNDSFMKEGDVPELFQYDWNEQNFYDPIVSTHMGVRKLIHFVNEAESYGSTGTDIVRNALKGFNTGHANNEPDNTQYYESYPDEIAAMAGWYYANNHFNDNEFTWTSDPKVDRTDCWDWWEK